MNKRPPLELSFVPWQLDLRSLGVFRILLGLAIFWQVSWRVADYSYWYSPTGFDTPAVRDLIFRAPDYSFLNFNEPWPALVVTGLIFVLNIPFILGIWTRVLAPVLALLFWSMSLHRSYTQGNEIDVVFWCLVWASLLPIDKAFTYQKTALSKNEGNNYDYAYRGVAGLGLTLQVGFLYWMNSMYKSDPGWDDGTILHHFLSLGMYTRPFGNFLMTLPPELLSLLTLSVFLFERIALILLLLPWAYVRLVTVILLMLMHIGFGMAMSVGLYPYMCLVWLTALLPAEFWQLFRGKSGSFQHPQSFLKSTLTSKIIAGLVTAFMAFSNMSGFITKDQPSESLRQVGLLQLWGNFTSKDITVGHPLVLTQQNGVTVDLYRRHIAHLPAEEIVLTQPENGPAQYGNYGLLNIFDWRRDIHRKFIENVVAARNPVATEEGFKSVAQHLCQLEATAGRPVDEMRAMWYDYADKKASTFWQGACMPRSYY